MRLKELREQERTISWFKAQELKRHVDEAVDAATFKQESQFEKAREQALEACNSQFMQALEKLGQGQIDAQVFSAQVRALDKWLSKYHHAPRRLAILES
eukprot:scaffold20119_cov20-Tisochrysis_lutea.AAC.1